MLEVPTHYARDSPIDSALELETDSISWELFIFICGLNKLPAPTLRVFSLFLSNSNKVISFTSRTWFILKVSSFRSTSSVSVSSSFSLFKNLGLPQIEWVV